MTLKQDKAHTMSNTLTNKLGFWERISRKLLFCVVLSFFAALATLSYGYQFVNYFPLENKYIILYVGAIFGISSMLANVMLGTYSLMNIKTKKIQASILTVSSVGALPYGFLSFFAYQNVLPSIANIFLSSIVVIVNAGIGYTAFQNLWDNIKNLFKKSATKTPTAYSKVFVVTLGFLIGTLISVLTYLAACSGITDLLIQFNQTTLVKYHAGYILAILSWLPCAALFANANQAVALNLYTKISHFKKFVTGISKSNVAFFIFCLCSGTAIAQMVTDSFATTKHIPEFFRADYVLALVQYIVPVALLSSAALNYFAIDNLFKNFKDR
jgi:hypothetical protein